MSDIEKDPKENDKDTLFDKEAGVKFAFAIGQMVQVKGFGMKYLVQNRYPYKGHPFYDLLNFDANTDWRNYQQVIEEILEPEVAANISTASIKFGGTGGGGSEGRGGGGGDGRKVL